MWFRPPPCAPRRASRRSCSASTPSRRVAPSRSRRSSPSGQAYFRPVSAGVAPKWLARPTRRPAHHHARALLAGDWKFCHGFWRAVRRQQPPSSAHVTCVRTQNFIACAICVDLAGARRGRSRAPTRRRSKWMQVESPSGVRVPAESCSFMGRLPVQAAPQVVPPSPNAPLLVWFIRALHASRQCPSATSRLTTALPDPPALR